MSAFFSSPEFIATLTRRAGRRLRQDPRSPRPGRLFDEPPLPLNRPSSSSRPTVQVQLMINAVQAALAGQGSLAGGDVAVEEALDHLVAPWDPPSARRPWISPSKPLSRFGRSCPTARSISSSPTAIHPCASPRPSCRPEPTPSEDLDARITLRVPPSLKSLVEDAAETAGASVNTWVLDALSANPQTSHRVTGSA